MPSPDDISRTIGRLEGKLEALDTRQTQHEARTQQRHDSLERKLDSMDEQLSEINGKLHKSEGAFVTLMKFIGFGGAMAAGAAWLFDKLVQSGTIPPGIGG